MIGIGKSKLVNYWLRFSTIVENYIKQNITVNYCDLLYILKWDCVDAL